MSGPRLVFNMDDISLLDINDLIDAGVRFTLRSSDYEESIEVGDYLKDGNIVFTVSDRLRSYS